MWIKIFWIFLIIFFSSLYKTTTKEVRSRFPKKIWVYWHEQNKPDLIKYNYWKIKQQSTKIGYELIVLNEINFKDYIDIQAFQKASQKIKKIFIESKADLIKLFILQKYGGIFIDLTLHLVEDLKWIQSLVNISGLTNANTKDKPTPDVLMFYNPFELQTDDYSMRQNKIFKQKVAYETYFIAAVPNSLLIKQWKFKFIKYQKNFYSQMLIDFLNFGQKSIKNLGISSYGKIKLSLYSVLSQRQIKLNKQIKFFNLNTKKNVNQFYHIWSINCIQGPCIKNIIQNQNQKKNSQFFLTTLQFQRKYMQNKQQIRYFYKPDKNYRLMIQNIVTSQAQTMQKTQQIPKTQNQQDLIKWKSKINCSNEFYYIKGSIFDKFILSSRQVIKNRILSENLSKIYLTECQQRQFIKRKPYYIMIILLIMILLIWSWFFGRKWYKEEKINKFYLYQSSLNTIKIKNYFQKLIQMNQQQFLNWIDQIFEKLIIKFYPCLILALTLLIFYWDINHQKNYQSNLLLIFLSISCLKIFINLYHKNIFEKLNTLELQVMLSFSFTKSLLMMINIPAYQIVFDEVYIAFVGFWILKINQKNSDAYYIRVLVQSKQPKCYNIIANFYKIIGLLKGNYNLIILVILFIFNFFPHLMYFMLFNTSLIKVLKYFIKGYIILMSLIILFTQIFEWLSEKLKNCLNYLKKKSQVSKIISLYKKNQNYSDFKQLFLVYWVLFIMYILKVLFYQTINLESVRVYLQPNLLIFFMYYAYERTYQTNTIDLPLNLKLNTKQRQNDSTLPQQKKLFVLIKKSQNIKDKINSQDFKKKSINHQTKNTQINTLKLNYQINTSQTQIDQIKPNKIFSSFLVIFFAILLYFIKWLYFESKIQIQGNNLKQLIINYLIIFSFINISCTIYMFINYLNLIAKCNKIIKIKQKKTIYIQENIIS